MECVNQNNCVCDTVKYIAEIQQKIYKYENTVGKACIRDFELNNNLNTIPLLFICKDSCNYFIGSGIFRDETTSNFLCIESPVFRVSKIKQGTCCAEIELLQPQTELGTVPPFTNNNGICRFFASNTISRFIRTGICITVNLECFCGVECLPAVDAQPGVPQLPPDICVNPMISVNAPDNITCTGIITGSVTCDGEPLEDATVFLDSNPDLVNFIPNPVITDDEGNFSAIAEVPPGTDPTPVIITAETTVNNVTISDTDPSIVECPENGNACMGCGIHIGTEVSETTITVTTPEGGIEQFTGTLNLNALSCGESCNPANNNFNVQFRGTGDDSGTTINFIQGRRTIVSCNPPSTATITGPAIVTGNNPFPNNQVFTVTINVTNADTQPGNWVIMAEDEMGNTFMTSFTGTVNPNVIQVCP